MQTIEPRGSVSVCPDCGYRDGFHVAFNFEGDSGEGRAVLICPSCRQHYDIGWVVSAKGSAD